MFESIILFILKSNRNDPAGLAILREGLHLEGILDASKLAVCFFRRDNRLRKSSAEEAPLYILHLIIRIS